MQRIHNWLRSEVAALRDGTSPTDARSLGAHCLAFCSVLTNHHTAEDRGVFPALAERHPELREVLQGLSQDHSMIGTMLAKVERIGRELIDEPDESRATALRSELDGISIVMESHFSWEERRILAALDDFGDELSQVGKDASTKTLLGVDPPAL
ncbi:hemerythrin domain-containing protein [Actinoalloteichus hymeniacidonis]|uniref:Hemerythrin HHE cation binding domain-containing protein n=1 Tax=Actinoalloteichus hymeniacidonis TaxID=340345 RepID=A0AAC9HUP1_9PSEU|nr:hemerythrin domain-containing protein [Actinoalloteichus hymeniacidonis]AOS65929.1 hemerythrin HHE cation binding domain-containing protein [Actinoalloteichus hymeniacidonis]MBB5905975.1 iron-sulfur cluster repair protein YtfE (RIC family) [Actinoalloteichus hymeniacidonis]